MRQRLQFVLKTAQTFRTGGCNGFQSRACSTFSSPPHLFFEERKMKFIKRMERISSRQPVTKEVSLAGVLVPFCIAEGKPSILLTKRSNKLIRNKGDVSFPGGKMDSVDKDIIDTTLRETHEEIGLPRSDIEIWTSLKPISTRDRNLNVATVIGFVHNLEMSRLVIDSNEVSSVFTVSIEDLCNPANQAYTKFCNGVIMPLFIKKPYNIWGFTAIILDTILANLVPNAYSLKWRRKS